MSSARFLGTGYVIRAMAAYYRSDAQSLVMAEANDIPNHQFSNEIEKDGLRYVFLRSNERVLAVYRIDNADRLKRLKRWPSDNIDGLLFLDQLRVEAAAC